MKLHGFGGKESTHSADLGSIPGLGRSPGEGKGYPLQDSGLENSMDCIVHDVTKSQTRLSDSLTHSLTMKPISIFFCFINFRPVITLNAEFVH